MFRNDCFDMVVNINEKDIILSNEKTKEDIDNRAQAIYSKMVEFLQG